ncbi:MAG: ABC transporter permease [Deltaproteobacteria bacterium]|nr:ABC transporter permease [Deltaproteobacteria bacterium]
MATKKSYSPHTWAIGQVESLGHTTLESIQGVGECALLFAKAVRMLFHPPFRVPLLFRHMEFIGNKSLGVVLLTGMFTGMVMTFQSYRTLKDFGSETVVGGLVAVSMVRELGPVLSSLMVTARAGSAVAAEIGSMRVTEQIDALEAMAVDPVQYLVTPRLVAGLLMMPFLAVFSDLIGVLGSYLVGVSLLGVDGGVFLSKVYDFVTFGDIMQGTVKSMVFGLILTLVGSYKGYTTQGGAEGVGRATTEAVVAASILILFSDYIITVFWQS